MVLCETKRNETVLCEMVLCETVLWETVTQAPMRLNFSRWRPNPENLQPRMLHHTLSRVPRIPLKAEDL